MTPQQVAKEQTAAQKLGFEHKAPETREQLENLIAGLLAHHSTVEFTHRSKARSLLGGLQVHGLLQQYG